MAIFFDYIKGQSTGLKNTKIQFVDSGLPFITVDNNSYGNIVATNAENVFILKNTFQGGLRISTGQTLENLGTISGGAINGSTISDSTITNTTTINESIITNPTIQSSNTLVKLLTTNEGVKVTGNLNISSGNLNISSGNLDVGSGKVYAQTFYARSDERLKDNIKDCDYGLDIIQKIKVKEYNFKNDGNIFIGCIAQELDEILPEELKDSIVAKEEYLAINDSKLIYFLINAVKELQKQINELRK